MSIRGRLTTVLLIVLIPLFLFSACDLLTGEVTPPPKRAIEVRVATENIIVSWENPDDLFITVVEVKNDTDTLVDLQAFPPETNSFNFTAEEGGYYNFSLNFILNDKTIIESREERAFLLKSNLPIIYINTPGGVPIDSKEWVDKAKGLGLSTFTIENTQDYNLTVDGDIRGRGNSTWGMPKKPYNIKLESSEELLGFPKHKKWVLLANYSDKSLLRTEFAFNLGSKIFDNLEWTPDVKSVELVLNGEYMGVYQLVEKIELDKRRLDIKANKDNYATGDFLIEIDERLDRVRHFRTEAGVPITIKDPEKLNDTEFEIMQGIVQDLEDAIMGGDYSDHIDIDSFIDWYLINELTKNVDAQKFSSIFLYYVSSKEKFYMGPLWDFDLSSGNVNYYDCDKEEGFYVKEGPWYAKLFADPAFVTKVQNRWAAKREDVLTAIEDIEEMARDLEIGQTNNFQRWEILGKYVWPNRVWPATYNEEIDELVGWLTTRYHWLDINLALL
ncbi:MAG: hypothetical protein GX842_05210 [Spirochaetales bacterium]|nr:hypothetical protein [Spirochaetales bacterium]